MVWWAAWGVMGVLVALSFGHADGHFVYSLDDPYIHLALARTIQHGGYGINVGEWASPSSSPLWPFLLAAVPGGAMEWAPVVFNGLCCAATVAILREVLRGPLLPGRWQVPGALLAGFGLNLFGIAMTGMEHSLQVLLAVFMAWRVVQGRLDGWLYGAMAVAPLVRYELAGLSFPLALYLWWVRKERWGPACAVLVAVAGLVVFSAWLHSLGLPWLPSSVMAKNAERSVFLNAVGDPGFYFMLWWLWWTASRTPAVATAPTDAGAAWRHGRREWWLLMACPLVGFLVLGRIGWLGRYEAYMAGWLLVWALHAAQQPWPQPAVPRVWHPRHPGRVFAGLSLCLPALWGCTLMTPQACLNTQRQQVVLAELARQLGQPVAVNDLGLVAWRSGQYVVDLWGLGSPEVLARRLEPTAKPELWMDEVTRAKGARFAFVFERWFPKVPPGWVKVGELRLNVARVVVPSKTVALYATSPQAVPALQQAMQRVAQDPVRRALLFQLP